jgi:hypothetical protein
MTSKTVRSMRRQGDAVSKALCFSATQEEDAEDRSSVTSSSRFSDTNNSELEDIQENSLSDQPSFCSEASTIFSQQSWLGPSSRASLTFGRPSSMCVCSLLMFLLVALRLCKHASSKRTLWGQGESCYQEKEASLHMCCVRATIIYIQGSRFTQVHA